ncbi:MAG TPA: hypothetical protein VIL89_02475, partial [Clostridia bacterium]
LAETDKKVGRRKHGICSEKILYPGECVIPDFRCYLEGGINVHLSESEGYKSAGIVTPYPPGIPVLCPGETILKEHIDYLSRLYDAGADIHGLTFVTETEGGSDSVDLMISVLPE